MEVQFQALRWRKRIIRRKGKVILQRIQFQVKTMSRMVLISAWQWIQRKRERNGNREWKMVCIIEPFGLCSGCTYGDLEIWKQLYVWYFCWGIEQFARTKRKHNLKVGTGWRSLSSLGLSNYFGIKCEVYVNSVIVGTWRKNWGQTVFLLCSMGSLFGSIQLFKLSFNMSVLVLHQTIIYISFILQFTTISIRKFSYLVASIWSDFATL